MPLHQTKFFLVFACAATWIGLVAIASVVYRLKNGKPIFRPTIERPLFMETWRSGRCLRTAFSRFGGARNCLWIAVTETKLIVAPHFPFNLMFLPERLGLEYEVTGGAIQAAEQLDRDRVRIAVTLKDNTIQTFELVLAEPDAFLKAVQYIRGKE